MFDYAVSFCKIFGLFTAFASFAASALAASDARISESYGKLPLHFEANQGQAHEDVRFLARGHGYGLYLTAGEAVLVLTRSDAKRDAQPQAKPAALRMSLVGAARKPLLSGRDELPGKANYFIGKDQSKWRTNVPTYAKVRYRGVYPGIDLLYYGNQRQLEYDFVVAPGADPKKIVLGFKGADKLEIDAQGELVLHVGGSEIRQHKPVVYQEIGGVRREIDGGYVLKGAKRVGFQLAAYDRNRPLIIDPVVLSYSTYLGGSNNDRGSGIAVDGSGNAYVTGGTTSTNFPTEFGGLQRACAGTFCGGGEAFVTKLNPTGSALIYSTYLGGTGQDMGGFSIAVDLAGNAYVTGSTESGDFPTTVGAYQRVQRGFTNAFITKLNPTGSALIYSTLLGGDNFNSGSGIAVDAAGSAYVTGRTSSNIFPTTAGAFQMTFAGGGFFAGDAFVTKLDPAGSTPIYSTYLGGSGSDEAWGIALDSEGNAYVTGRTQSKNFPTTAGAYQPALRSGATGNAFVTKLNTTGSAAVYSTYLGGSRTEFDFGSADEAFGIAVDIAGNAYVTGETISTDFPTTSGAFQPAKRNVVRDVLLGGTTTDGFVTKLDPTGSALVYSTYLGGSESDHGRGIAVDSSGNAYVTGWTRSIDFPTTVEAVRPIRGDASVDAFVTKLNQDGSTLVYSTYLGGGDADVGVGIFVDAQGDAYVTGATVSTDFPTTPGVFQPNSGGNEDAFVAKITNVVLPALPSIP
jgi:hypothetical protein